METILEYVKNNWVVWLFTVISALLGFFVRRLYARFREEQEVRLLQAARESEEQKIIKEGILAILHDRLYQACRFHLGNGKIGVSELRNIEYLYTSYHDLGGNGTGTELCSRVRSLPIKEEKE